MSVVSIHPLSSGNQLVYGSPASVHMMLEPLTSPQGNTYVNEIPTDDLTQELDHHAGMAYAEHIEERN